MPTLDIERKESSGVPMWLWIVAGLILLGLIAWLLIDQPWRTADVNVPAVGQIATEPGATDTTDDRFGAADTTAGANGADAGTAAGTTADGQAAGQGDAREVQSEGAWFPLDAIRANPDAHFGQTVTGVGTVTEVAGDWGFWVEREGTSMFIVKDNTTPQVETGQRVVVTGTVRNPHDMEQNPRVLELPEATRQNLHNAPAYIQATSLRVLGS